MSGAFNQVKKMVSPVASLFGGESGGGSFLTKTMQGVVNAIQEVAPPPPPPAQPAAATPEVPSVAETKAPRRQAGPMGVTETPRRRRRSSRVNTLLSDLNEDRLGG